MDDSDGPLRVAGPSNRSNRPRHQQEQQTLDDHQIRQENGTRQVGEGLCGSSGFSDDCDDVPQVQFSDSLSKERVAQGERMRGIK